jgi:hypothetical protein
MIAQSQEHILYIEVGEIVTEQLIVLGPVQ